MVIAPTAVPMEQDLGPLAWVLDELRKSLDGATKAIRRFVRDAQDARGSALESLDASQLRMARQQLHQAVGALEMVGLSESARVLRALEAVAHKFVEHPEACSEDAVTKVERCSFAVMEFLQAVLRGRPVSAVGLFPQYRDVLLLAGEERIHPADLWRFDWRWAELELPLAAPLSYDLTVRARMDPAVLALVKGEPGELPAQTLHEVALGLAAGQPSGNARIFWGLCAAFFESIALGLRPLDVYVKRMVSRILMQYIALAKGQLDISERLALDLLFYCALTQPSPARPAPVLGAVRAAHGLSDHAALDYERVQFGRFDPAVVTQARKRIATATETWSALTGGDASRLRQLPERLGLVCDSIKRLFPEGVSLSDALLVVVERTVRSGQLPAPALSMEVATAILYLDAACEDLGAADLQMKDRCDRLAHRLEQVMQGLEPDPLEAWMEDLYRRISDRQTMGSVVNELRTALSDVEKALDQFLRNSADVTPLGPVGGQLNQMRGVFSVLGLEQASQAALHMRGQVEQLVMSATTATPVRPDLPEKLANSLGAMGLLIDMLSHQRTLAKKLFVYDDAQDELVYLMGRQKQTSWARQAGPEAPMEEPSTPVAAPIPSAPTVPQKAPAVEEAESAQDSAELLEIFLEEAKEVLAQAHGAISSLQETPSDDGMLTTLRRAFHTLKGSSRMVGLQDFGEAAWAMEQLLNSWLADRRSASPDLLALCTGAWSALARWIDAVAQGAAQDWVATPFRVSADALRLRGAYQALSLPWAPEPQPLTEVALQTEVQPAPTPEPELSPEPAPEALMVESAESLQQAPDFSSLPQAPQEATPASLERAENAEKAEKRAPESVRVIGDLQISIPLFNVYLNEADEWSRRLQTALGEWALEPHDPIPQQAVAHAHSLAGSSATVGFDALADLARNLEQALEHVQVCAISEPSHTETFLAAAEHIRYLLHQFAAGFLKEADPDILQALKAIQVAPAVRVPPGAPPSVPEVSAPVEMKAHAATTQEAPATDQVDADLFAIFQDEARELLVQLSAAFRQWAARPDNFSARSEILRVLHTFKGSARLAGAMRLGERAHQLEFAIESLGVNQTPAVGQIAGLHADVDALQALFDGMRADSAGAVPEPAQPVPVVKEATRPSVPDHVPAPAERPAPGPAASPTLPRPSQGPLVRVRSKLLDRLLNQAGEVMLTRSRLDSRLGQLRDALRELDGNLERLRQQVRDVELQAETQMQSRLTLSRETGSNFDPLEFDRFTRVQELTRMMSESVNDVATVQRTLQRSLEGTEDDLTAQAHQTRELQRDLLKTRMVEFEGIAERLHTVVRQAAAESGKLVSLEIQGASLEMDRVILERMSASFEHLLRNAVAHGIEDPDQRERAGKPRAGLVRIHVRQEGNDVAITFADDGAGLDLPKIRDKAVAAGLIQPQHDLSDTELAALIFHPGLSTARTVTELAGRGIGMDVVRTEVQALGGRVATSSVAGQGTQFELVLPLTTAVTQVVMLRWGGNPWVCPLIWSRWFDA